jgi:endoglucanase
MRNARYGDAQRARHEKLNPPLVIVALLVAMLVVSSQSPRAAYAAATQDMYRLYNPNSGEHFYTASTMERDSVVAAGWRYEGVGWVAPAASSIPVYRLYSGTDHHYTMSATERDWLVAQGWRYEGIGWYSDEDKTVALYREFNPNVDPSAPTNNSGSHNYTTNKYEHDHLVGVGWRDEGIAWYAREGGRTLPPLASPSANGALRVRGTQLVDQYGNAVQLRGVSTHGLAWFPQYVNQACFRQLRQNWGANVVRLAMYTAEGGGYCSDGNQQELRALVKQGVDYARAADLYAIVDWHVLNDPHGSAGDADFFHTGEAVGFFDSMSQEFASYNNVIYEICNEPNGNTTWQDVKQYAEQVIPVIRANDPDAVILVGSSTWSQEIDKPLADPLPFANLMYTLHFYAATHKSDLRNRMVTCIKGGLPVFVSEFGICDASGNGTIDEAEADAWLQELNRYQVSWCQWSLCNKGESASIISSSCGKVSDFAQGDLSQSGRWLLHALNSESLPDAYEGGSGSSGGSGSLGGSSSGGSSAATATQAQSFTSDSLSCTLTLSNSWEEGGMTCYQYDLAITNTGAARSSWHVDVPFGAPIELLGSWNGSYAVSGSTLRIDNANYNGTLAAGQTLSGIGFQVKAAPGLTLAP